jgi:hypothetical protein
MIETETIELDDLDRRLPLEEEAELHMPQVEEEEPTPTPEEVDEFIVKMEARELEAEDKEKEQVAAEQEGHEIPPGEESSLAEVMDKFGGVVEDWNQTYSGSGEMFFDAARHEIVDAIGFSITEQINTYASADQAARHNEMLSAWIQDAAQTQLVEYTEPTAEGYVLHVTAISLEAGEVISHTWSREVVFDQGDSQEAENFAEILEEATDESSDKSRNILESAQQEVVVDLNEYLAAESYAQIEVGTEGSPEEVVGVGASVEVAYLESSSRIEQIMQVVVQEEISVPIEVTIPAEKLQVFAETVTVELIDDLDLEILVNQSSVEVAPVVVTEKDAEEAYEIQSKPLVLQESVPVKFEIPIVVKGEVRPPVETDVSATAEVEFVDSQAEIESVVVNAEEFLDIAPIVDEAPISTSEIGAVVAFDQSVVAHKVLEPMGVVTVESAIDLKPETVADLEIQKIETDSGIAIKVEEFVEEATEASMILEGVSPEQMEVLMADPEFNELMMDSERLQLAVEKLAQIAKPERVDFGRFFLKFTENTASVEHAAQLEKPLVDKKSAEIKTERNIPKQELIEPARVFNLQQKGTGKEIGVEQQTAAKKQVISNLKSKKFVVQKPPAKRLGAKPVTLSKQNVVVESQRFKRAIVENDSRDDLSAESRSRILKPKTISLNEMAKRSFRSGVSYPVANSTVQEEDELEQPVGEVKKAA